VVQPDHGRGQFQAGDGSNNAHFSGLQPTTFTILQAVLRLRITLMWIRFHFDVDTDLTLHCADPNPSYHFHADLDSDIKFLCYLGSFRSGIRN